MRFHVLGLAHVAVRAENTCCAYTMKVYNLCRMLKALGHHVTLYALAGSDATICDELVECARHVTWARVYGQKDTKKYQFDWDSKDQCWSEFKRRARFEIPRHFETCEPERPEFVLCSFGWAHEPCTKSLPENAVVVESGIGYRNSWADFRVFESRALYHFALGQGTPQGVVEGKFYWTVIPNYYDPSHFDYSTEKEDYFLYMGRLNRDKGFTIAVDTGRALGVRTICVGQLWQGDDKTPGAIREAGGEYRESVGPDERRVLLAKARAVFVPSLYIEPFGGINVEAMLSGTPVITTDWGAFGETVIQGVTGFRCKTMAEFVWAAANAQTIQPAACRRWALENFSMDAVAPRYQAYFTKLWRLRQGKGWGYLADDVLDGGEIISSIPKFPSARGACHMEMQKSSDA